MDDERKPFLDSEEHEEFTFASRCHCRHIIPPHKKWKYWCISAIGHCLIASIWFFPSVVFQIPTLSTNTASPELFNPAVDFLEYTVHTPSVDVWNSELYMGKPSRKSDLAWNELMKHQTVRLAAEEAARLNTSAAPLPGQGHAAMFGVFHNLHCMRRLRQRLHPHYYYPNETSKFRVEDEHHTIHCLEAIRTSLMCYPDLTPLPLVWGGGDGHPLLAAANVPRRCVDWNRLMEWSIPRNYQYDDILEGMKEAGLEDQIPGTTPYSPIQ